AGSACGKNLSTERQSTIGRQRATNYACAPMDEAGFVSLVTDGQPAAPGYFGYDADLNRRDRELFDAAALAAPLDADDFLARRADGVVVVDARDPLEFAAGHLVGAVNVPADGRFAEQSGTVLDPAWPLLVIAPEGREQETVTRLARIGFDRVAGYLADPETAFRTVPEQMRQAPRRTVADLRTELAGAEPPLVVDVRGEGERAEGSIPGSVHLPLAELPHRLGEIPQDRAVVVHCAGGHRSSIAASLLRHHGHPQTSDLLGGYGAWAAAA
ncbi:MAG: rhodanese-like domain-containing protein, partial [Kitasatospora sp.]|nr:rhodanese-like domain-containing protein [Kitasatospora sp.]